jgi:hypothetical protein
MVSEQGSLKLIRVAWVEKKTDKEVVGQNFWIYNQKNSGFTKGYAQTHLREIRQNDYPSLVI